MSRASQIVDALLEADESSVNIEPDFDAAQYVNHHTSELEREAEADRRSGVVNVRTAMTAHYFYHRTATYKDGRTPIQVRRNGSTKRWVRQPEKFRIPVKYGMYEFFYITDENADEWTTVPPPIKPKPEKVSRPKPVVNPSSLMPPL
jgi:hypothetical protein